MVKKRSKKCHLTKKGPWSRFKVPSEIQTLKAKTMPNILSSISQIVENESILWVSRLGHDFYFPGQSFLDSPTGKSWNNAASRPRIEFNGDMFAECVLLAIAVCVNLALFVATIKGIPLLFMPWMLFYGFEVLAGWAITLAFLILPGTLHPTKWACRDKSTYKTIWLLLRGKIALCFIAAHPFEYPSNSANIVILARAYSRVSEGKAVLLKIA